MKVFIENEAGSFIKHIYNERTLTLKGTVGVSRAYPFPYGFVPHTSAEDGDSLDCFVLTQALRSGQMVECEVLGLNKLKMEKLTTKSWPRFPAKHLTWIRRSSEY